MKQGARVELPLWLGEMLAVRCVVCIHAVPFGCLIDVRSDSQRLGTSPLVTLDIPSALSPRVMNALKANPRTVDLRALAPHFYGLAERILDLFEEDEMVEVLSEV